MKKEVILPTKITNELAYLTGILAGDGNIHIRNKRKYAIKCVGHPQDEQDFYYDIIGPIFNKLFGIILKLKYHDKSTTFGFVLNSKEIVNFFIDIGLPSGRKDNIRIPRKLKVSERLIINFIRGIFDTDGCITFKKRYRKEPYYPVIIFSSKSKKITKEIACYLKRFKFKIVEIYDYKVKDKRIKRGYTIINRIELNGRKNLELWMKTIGFWSPKHLEKIKKIARGGFEFGNSQSLNCFHRPSGYEPSAPFFT